MTDQPELANCPFCDGKPQLSLDDDAYYCEDCGSMPYVEKGCDPADVWNTRPRTIPKWLRDKIADQIGAMSVFSEEYSSGYDEALEWVLSLEDEK